MSDDRNAVMRRLAEKMDEVLSELDRLDVAWWVRQGWSLRKLNVLELIQPAESRQVEMFDDGQGAVVHPGTGGEDVRGSGQELRGSRGEAAGRDGAPAFDAASYAREVAKAALGRKPKAGKRFRKRRRR